MSDVESGNYRNLYAATAEDFATIPRPISSEQFKNMKESLAQQMIMFVNATPDAKERMARLWELKDILESIYPNL